MMKIEAWQKDTCFLGFGELRKQLVLKEDIKLK